MPASPAPSSTGSSSKLWLILGAVALLALGLLWTQRGGSTAEDDPREAAAALEAGEARSPATGPAGPAPTLEPVWTTASGQVSASSGEAIAGALVTLAPLDEDAGEPWTTRTDAGGGWSMAKLPAGRYALSATAAGYLGAARPEVRVRAEADNAGLDLRLEPGGATLSGVVSDKTGGVIEGALVQVTPAAGVVSMREHESYYVASDAEGRYAVQVAAGRQRVRASHSDYSSEAVVLELAAEARTQDFALVPTAVVEGVVVREQGGAAVPFAEVSWSRQRMVMLPGGGRVSTIDRGGKVTASAEGRFRISGLPPGTIELEARASGLASFSPVQVPVGIAEQVAELELRLAAASDVEGRVVAVSDGRGLAGARVELMSQLGPGLSAETGEDGRFTLLGVLPGRYQAIASAEGFDRVEGAPPTLVVDGTDPAPLELELREAASIRGRVVPAARAEVSIELQPGALGMGGMGGGGMMVLSMAEPTHASAETGEFELGPIQPGHYTLQARTADGRGGSVEVEVGQDGLSGVVIELEARATLVGRVEDFSGKLLDDVTVRARKRRANSSLSVSVNGRELTALSAPTSTEGGFEIAGLDAGAWFVEVVDRQGEVLALDVGERLELDLAKGETRELLLRVEPRDGRISGTVRDAEGEPVADAWVSAAFIPEARASGPGEGDEDEDEGEGEHRAEVRMLVVDGAGTTMATLPPVLTDSDGRFVFDGLRRGSYSLSAELDGGSSKASLDEVRPDAEVSLELAPLARLEGTVLADGKAIDCVARITGPSERTVRVRDGSFEAERLEPGAYVIEARTPEGATRSEVELEAGETSAVNLTITRLATIRGRVVDQSGAPLPGVEIMIGAGGGGRIEISQEDGDPQYFTDEEGKFEARAAAGGRVLLAIAPGTPMPLVVKPFTVEGGEDIELGDLRKKEMEGMMMMEGEGPPPAHGE